MMILEGMMEVVGEIVETGINAVSEAQEASSALEMVDSFCEGMEETAGEVLENFGEKAKEFVDTKKELYKILHIPNSYSAALSQGAHMIAEACHSEAAKKWEEAFEMSELDEISEKIEKADDLEKKAETVEHSCRLFDILRMPEHSVREVEIAQRRHG